MASLTVVLNMVGVILFTILGTGLADCCTSASIQNSIRATLISQLNSGTDGEVEFKELVGTSLNPITPSKSKTEICETITALHASSNAGFLGVAISSAACQEAFTSPDPAALTKWAGKHSFIAGTLGSDDAVWATPTSSPVTQSMFYFNRGTPCCFPYNKIVSFENKVIGYDPLDDVGDYDCYQGTYVAYPFSVIPGVDCMVKLTGTNAFLECIKHGTNPKKRTSAGFFGGYYAHYNVEPLTSTCP